MFMNVSCLVFAQPVILFDHAGNIANNGVLSFVKYVVMPLFSSQSEEFKVDRAPENGGPITFKDFESLEQAFAKEVRNEIICTS